MTKIPGSGSGSISQRHGSADPDPDPDPHQNVMYLQHWIWDPGSGMLSRIRDSGSGRFSRIRNIDFSKKILNNASSKCEDLIKNI